MEIESVEHQLLSTLKLVARSHGDTSGWAECASAIYEQLIKDTPDELIEKRIVDGVCYARLTDEAKIVLKWA